MLEPKVEKRQLEEPRQEAEELTPEQAEQVKGGATTSWNDPVEPRTRKSRGDPTDP